MDDDPSDSNWSGVCVSYKWLLESSLVGKETIRRGLRAWTGDESLPPLIETRHRHTFVSAELSERYLRALKAFKSLGLLWDLRW